MEPRGEQYFEHEVPILKVSYEYSKVPTFQVDADHQEEVDKDQIFVLKKNRDKRSLFFITRYLQYNVHIRQYVFIG